MTLQPGRSAKNKMWASHSSTVRDSNESIAESTTFPNARSVLIVDDDPLVQMRLKVLLESAGYSVMCVDLLQQARNAVARVFFPIVILDRTLADGDGITLCAELRDGPSRVFVLVLSVRDSQQDVGQGMRAGADAYLSKRTSDAELLAYLDAASTVARFAATMKGTVTRT